MEESNTKKPSSSDTGQADTKNPFTLEAPVINLPKGGGALKSMDDKMQVNAANGTASFTLPLPFSKARSSLMPPLSLSYSSGSGNGELGLGWSLNCPAIQRRTSKQLPRYFDNDASDIFQFTGVEDLVPSMMKDDTGNWVQDSFTTPSGEYVMRYHPRIDTSFSLIERITPAGSGTFYWKVTTGDNIVTVLGKSTAARIADPEDETRIFKWLPELSFDDKGNCLEFEYLQEDLTSVPSALYEQNRFAHYAVFTNTYLKRIKYGNNTPYLPDATTAYNLTAPTDPQYYYEFVIDFGDHDTDNPTPAVQQNWPCRLDPFSDYHACFEIRTYRLTRRFLFFHYFKELNDGKNPSPCLIKSIDLQYRYVNNSLATPAELRNAETDYIISIQQWGYKKNGAGYSKKGLPPLDFSYQELNWNTNIVAISPDNLVNAPIGLGEHYQWLDIWNEGISGILSEDENAWYYKSNLGDGQFSVAERVARKPSFSGLGSGTLQLQDLEADGRKFIVSLQGPARGYFELSDCSAWQPFQSFNRLPNVDTRDENTKFIDLNGDGRPDLIISEEAVFTWYPNEGIAGYDQAEHVMKPFDEEKGPAMVFRDPLQTIFLADANGDGMTDILRIRNGEVCYWPNLGYGKFGAKVNMSFAPVFDSPDLFNPSYLHLADISGTGATDILYLGRSKFTAWLNLSGNAWSTPVSIDPFPTTELPNQLAVMDLLGNGTPCIVWSSPLPQHMNSPMRYIDLMGGKKPYVMDGYKNNFGKEISWEYKSSTWYYLQDKKAGKPWITRLPFPVQCVSKVNVNDLTTGTYLTNCYSYHHGYYDHPEKEYRGFGRVEKTDTEDFTNFALSGATNVVEQDLHQPPVKTISWFHTGAFFDLNATLSQFETEYTKGPFEFDLPACILPAGLSAQEYREALRACKGITLREEVYAMDGSPLQSSPYSVSMHNCLIKLMQPEGANPYAVFHTHESEALTLHYERNLDDPRILHTLNLEIDDYGNVLQAASVVYGRKTTDPSLPGAIQAEQERAPIVYTLNSFTVAIDQQGAYRLPQAAEAISYELTGASPSNAVNFQVSDLLTAFSSATDIGYEISPTGGLQRRQLSDVRTIYLQNDLTTPLPLGQMDTLGLVDQQYKLAFTPSLITSIFGSRVTTPMLTEAKYVQEDAVNWWLTSGRNIYLTGADTVADAQKRFYLPVAVQDPFSNETTMTYDDYTLLLIQTQDAVQNLMQVEVMDYRTLMPAKTIGINDNTSEILTDELGMVFVSSIYGTENDGNHGDQPLSAYVPVAPANLADVITNPQKFLQGATSYFYYDPFAWINDGQPACSAGLTRETHQSDLSAGSFSRIFARIEYWNGSGGSLQTKAQAEPGLAWQWDAGVLTQVDTTPALRWIGSGRTILNNKGKPVKQYEPFFSVNYTFESEEQLVEIGFPSVMYYDPPGRAIRTEHANGTFSRVAFDAWKELHFDENDTVLDSQWYIDRGSPNPASPEPADPDTRAAWLTASHANTPLASHMDSMGRTIYTIADNATAGKYATQVVLDIENHRLAVIDARGNTVMTYAYDMASRQPYNHSMDGKDSLTHTGGDKWVFSDVLGKQVCLWDSRSHRFRSEYDNIHRPTKQWLIEDITKGSSEKLIGITVYGENQPNDKALNLRGQAYHNFDQSGLVESTYYDFKGNLKSSFKRLAKDYKQVVDWNVANPLTLLEAETFSGASLFNAMSQPVEIDLPDGSRILPAYNDADLLDAINIFVKSQGTTVPFVQNIDYNAKAQREKILYGNNTVTNYTYDEITYRLIRVLTTRNAGADILQDLNYTFDPVGNITGIQDNAQQTVFFNNAGVDPSTKFVYDAIYRLVNAIGREHAGQNAASSQFDTDKTQDGMGNRLTLKGDMNAMQQYQESYSYDEVGNMLQLVHNAGKGVFTNKWTRTFSIDPTSNQLAGSTAGAAATTFTYDAHGNMLNLQNGSFGLTWNYADRLSQVNLGGGGIAYYVYDAAGKRIRSVIENGSLVKERIYLSGYEIYREIMGGTVQLERQTIDVMDGHRRIALVETRSIGTDAGLPFLIRYQYGNHLGTACLEVDGNALNPDIISYEEYYPFGCTAYQAMRNQTETAKRYRYTGKERDEESGLYYHGARYYASWLVRWTTVDPIGIEDGPNVYIYSHDNPIILSDPNGKEARISVDQASHSVIYSTTVHVYSTGSELATARAAAARTTAFYQAASGRTLVDGQAWNVQYDVRFEFHDTATQRVPGGFNSILDSMLNPSTLQSLKQAPGLLQLYSDSHQQSYNSAIAQVPGFQQGDNTVVFRDLPTVEIPGSGGIMARPNGLTAELLPSSIPIMRAFQTPTTQGLIALDRGNNATEEQLFRTLTHEVGHTLGFDERYAPDSSRHERFETDAMTSRNMGEPQITFSASHREASARFADYVSNGRDLNDRVLRDFHVDSTIHGTVPEIENGRANPDYATVQSRLRTDSWREFRRQFAPPPPPSRFPFFIGPMQTPGLPNGPVQAPGGYPAAPSGGGFGWRF